MSAVTPDTPDSEFNLLLSENGHLCFENPNYQLESLGRIDPLRMEDHINSNIEPSVPFSLYQELCQEYQTNRQADNYQNRLFSNMGTKHIGPDDDKEKISELDNDPTKIEDSNKMSESIAEKTAKLHKLLASDKENLESEKLGESECEKEDKEKEKDNREYYSVPVKRRQKKTLENQLPEGWEKHEDSVGAYYWHIKSGNIQRETPTEFLEDEVHMMGPALRSSQLLEMDTDCSSVASSMQRSCTLSSIADIGKEQVKYIAEEKENNRATKKQDEKWKRRSLPSSKYNDESQSDAGFKSIQVGVKSLGCCELTDEDLTPEHSSKSVNRCIVDLSSLEMDQSGGSQKAGIFGSEDSALVLELSSKKLSLYDCTTGDLLFSQAIHSIRVWGVGRDNTKDFAFVARDKATRKHLCHVFRCDVPARNIANALRDICKKILIERSLAQSSSRLVGQKAGDRASQAERRSTISHSRPTSLAVSKGSGVSAEKSLQDMFPTPMEEPKKDITAWYLGSLQVSKPGGMDTINAAVKEMMETVSRDDWKTVHVSVAPSTVCIHFSDGTDSIDCRVRFLSFLGIGINVQQAAFIMHTAQDTFICHVFHCEPTAGPLCKTIEAACKLRYQKCLDARPKDFDKNRPGRHSIGATIKNMFGAFSKKNTQRSPDEGGGLS